MTSQTLWKQLDVLAAELGPTYEALREKILAEPVIGLDQTSSARGTQVAALFYSALETAKLNDADPPHACAKLCSLRAAVKLCSRFPRRAPTSACVSTETDTVRTYALRALRWRCASAHRQHGAAFSQCLPRAQSKPHRSRRRGQAGLQHSPLGRAPHPATTGGQRTPLYKLGAAGLTSHRQRIEPSTEVTAVCTKQRHQYYRYRAGHVDGPFPYGTYKMRVHYGANVDPKPDPEALVTAPGPTFDDIKARLKRKRALLGVDSAEAAASEAKAEAARLAAIDNVKHAFATEADQVRQANVVDFQQPNHDEPASGRRGNKRRKHRRAADANDDDELQPPIRKHRFHKLDLHDGVRPRRIVTLRDARRGRPKKGSSDPPA